MGKFRSVAMTRYAVSFESGEENIAKSRGSHLRVHFKHCREITHFLTGMSVKKAQVYLDRVLKFEAVIPFVKFTGGIGRKACAKNIKAPGSIGRFPVKAVGVVKDLLANAAANAEGKGLDVDELIITHAQCNRAPAGRRRTYRAHGRIGKYASQPAHIELILSAKKAPVEKAPEEPKKITKKAAARKRFVKVGGAP